MTIKNKYYIKKIIYLLIFLFLIPSLSFAATLTVDTGGSDSGDCTVSSCASVVYALTQSGAGDIININDGTYYEGLWTVPVDVDIVGTSADPDLVDIYPSVSSSATPFVSLYSATPGTVGSQTLSGFHLHGQYMANNVTHGVRVVNRDGVTINDVDFSYFTGTGGTPSTDGSGGGSYGLYVRGTEQAQNASWWNYFDNDGTKSSSWSTNPVQNFAFYNSTMDHCGYGDNPESNRTFSPAIYLFDLKTFTFHDLSIDVSHSQTEGIRGNCAILEDGSFYNIYILCNSAGRIYASSGTEGCFSMELWVFDNVDFYNIKSVNGGLSLAYGLNCSIYNAFVDQSAATSPTGYGIEWTLAMGGSIHDTRVAGNASAGSFYGYHLGSTSANVSASYTTQAYNNYAYDIRRDGFRISADGSTNAFTVTIQLHNNFVDNVSTGYSDYAGFWLQDANNGTLSVVGRNNIVTNSANGIKIGAGSPTTDFQYTALAGNTHDTTGSVTISNTISTEPTYEDYANKDFDLAVGSSAIYAGEILGLPYDQGINPSTTVWGSGSTLPVVNTVLHSVQDASNASLGPAVYLSGADVTGPTVSNKYNDSVSTLTNNYVDGHQYPAGTTTVYGFIDVTDSSGLNGCECNNGTFTYGTGTTMTNVSGSTYRCTISGLIDGNSYSQNYICQDASANTNETAGTWSFSVGASTSDIYCDDADDCYSETGTGWASAYRPGDAYADYHRYSNTTNDTCTFAMAVTSPGTYRVDIHTFDGGHDTAAALSIEHDGGTTNTTINLIGADGGEWVDKGTYDFSAGSYDITLTVASAFVIGDAARLILVQSGSGGSVSSTTGFSTGRTNGGHITGR